MVARTGAAGRLHRDSVIIDTHCDALGSVLEGRRLGERSSRGQFDLPRAIAGGLTAEFLAIFLDVPQPGGNLLKAIQYVDLFHREIEGNAELALHVTRADDIQVAKQQGKVALLLSMEGAEPLEGDLGALRVFYRLGLRSLGITWNRRNEAADGVGELGTGGGLSHFGEELVRECNRLGILLDLSHLAPAGVEAVLALSETPPVATHANCHALWQHPRNLTDAQLEAIAARGGVVGVAAVPLFLGENSERSSLSTMLDHLDHMVSVMGEDHVGLGTDFDGVGDARVDGLGDAGKLPNLTAGLLERGYSHEAIGNVLGGNFLRVLRQVIG
jgi:membrane dipeptidase